MLHFRAKTSWADEDREVWKRIWIARGYGEEELTHIILSSRVSSEPLGGWECLAIRRLTFGKKPSVNTLSRLVLPQAPSPIMTSFLNKQDCQHKSCSPKRGNFRSTGSMIHRVPIVVL